MLFLTYCNGLSNGGVGVGGMDEWTDGQTDGRSYDDDDNNYDG